MTQGASCLKRRDRRLFDVLVAAARDPDMCFVNIAVCEADHTESCDEEGEENGSESSTVFHKFFMLHGEANVARIVRENNDCFVGAIDWSEHNFHSHQSQEYMGNYGQPETYRYALRVLVVLYSVSLVWTEPFQRDGKMEGLEACRQALKKGMQLDPKEVAISYSKVHNYRMMPGSQGTCFATFCTETEQWVALLAYAKL